MDDGEVVISNQEVFSSPNMEGDIPGGYSMDSFFDEILKDSHACTHTHTCNPPGPDYSHTHTCFHVHTKIVPASPEENDGTDDTAESSDKKSSKKRPLGNREAVRKYREKKKARAASLEDEVTRLRAVNQQLVKRLQSQGALEAEVARLKCLLVDIRGRIEGEIGSFPYQKPSVNGMMNNGAGQGMAGAYVVNPCNMQCDDQLYCLREDVDGKCNGLGMNGQGFNSCEFENLQCFSGQNPGTGLKEHHHGESHGNSSGLSKRKGTKYGGTRSSTAS